MIQKLTITKVWVDTKPTQYGSFKTNFKCTEYGDRWISGFAKECNWKEGDVVELDIVESDKKDIEGKPYINWKFINKEDEMKKRVIGLEISVGNLKVKVEQIIAEIKKMKGNGLPPLPQPNFGERKLTPEQDAQERADIKANHDDVTRRLEEMRSVNDELNAISEEEYANM